jgi:hypothetical protein
MEIMVSHRNTDWVIIISLLASAFLVLANFVNSLRARKLLSIVISVGGDEIALSYNPGKRVFSVDLLLLLASVLSMPLAIIASKFILIDSVRPLLLFGWAEYLRMALLTVLLLVFKNLMASIIGWVFSLQEELIQAQSIFLAHFNWISILTALMSLLVYFGPWPLTSAWLLAIVLLLGLLIAIFKTSLYTFRIGLPFSYFILYLCALEIIPISYLLFLV